MTQGAEPRRVSLSRFPVYALLAGLFPVLALFSSNLGYLSFSAALPVLAYAFALTLVWSVVALSMVRDVHAGAMLALVGVVLAYSYSALFDLYLRFIGLFTSSELLARERYFLAGCTLAIVLVAVVMRRHRERIAHATVALNKIGLVVVAIPSLLIAYDLTNDWMLSRRVGKATSQSFEFVEQLDRTTASRPDIYYILLDEYGRADQLQEVFGVDIGGFVEQLEQRGFFVAKESTCNYCRSIQSITSTFQMDYLDVLPEQFGTDSTSLAPLSVMLRDNPVWRAFGSLGYTTLAFQTGFHWGEFDHADLFYRYGPTYEASEFAARVLAMTPIDSIRLYASLVLGDPTTQAVEEPFSVTRQRRRVANMLEMLPRAVEVAGPKFVYAHMICPHPPFIFAPEGENPAASYSWDTPKAIDLRERGIRDPDYLAGYGPQVEFLNRELLPVIDAILASTSPPPVIVLQGDHGPGSLLHDTDISKSDLDERFGVFTAFFFPDGDYRELSHAHTSVNTFRVVFNKYFRAGLPYLETRNYFSSYDHPHNFLDVTDRVSQGE